MRGGGIRRRSQQSRREERRERPLYVPWLSSCLSWITCHMRFPHREAAVKLAKAAGRVPGRGLLLPRAFVLILYFGKPPLFVTSIVAMPPSFAHQYTKPRLHTTTGEHGGRRHP